jgi:hypothetical protein
LLFPSTPGYRYTVVWLFIALELTWLFDTGLALWTVVFTLELLLNFSTLVGLRIIPIFAEGLIIAQLMSDVRSQDRRAL